MLSGFDKGVETILNACGDGKPHREHKVVGSVGNGVGEEGGERK